MNGFADVDSEQSPAIASANSVDKEPKVNDDDKVSYVSSISLVPSLSSALRNSKNLYFLQHSSTLPPQAHTHTEIASYILP